MFVGTYVIPAGEGDPLGKLSDFGKFVLGGDMKSTLLLLLGLDQFP